MCQVHAARLPQRYGVGVGHRGLFGPLVHQASIAVLFPANGILICLEQRLGLGQNDSGRNPIQCGIRIGAGQRRAVGKFGAHSQQGASQSRGSSTCIDGGTYRSIIGSKWRVCAMIFGNPAGVCWAGLA